MDRPIPRQRQRQRLRIAISILLLAVGSVGCDSSPLYHPARMHIPLHTRGGETAISAYTGLGNDLDGRIGLDGSYAITDHIAVQLGGMSSNENEASDQLSYQLGLGVFQVSADSSLVYGAWALYGLGRQTTTYYDGEIEQSFSKYGLQAEAGLVSDHFESFAGLRFLRHSAPASLYTAEQNSHFIEPSIGMRIGWRNVKFGVQMVMSKRTDIATDNTGLLSFDISAKF